MLPIAVKILFSYFLRILILPAWISIHKQPVVIPDSITITNGILNRANKEWNEMKWNILFPAKYRHTKNNNDSSFNYV
jgi:hypothetical protein